MFAKLSQLPILKPLLSLLHSRKFLVGFATVVVDVLVAYEPRFEAVRVELIAAITFVGSMIVGGIAYEDVNK